MQLAIWASIPVVPLSTLEPLRPQRQRGTLLWHVVMTVIVASLNTSKAVRLNLCSYIAGDTQRSHVRLCRTAQVAHGKPPSLEFFRSQHGLFDLLDQGRHGLLAQRHASVRAEERKRGLKALWSDRLQMSTIA